MSAPAPTERAADFVRRRRGRNLALLAALLLLAVAFFALTLASLGAQH